MVVDTKNSVSLGWWLDLDIHILNKFHEKICDIMCGLS